MFLDGDIESCCGFVCNEDFGFAGESHGDHDTLLHSAAEFVGVGVVAFGGVADADLLEGLDDLGFYICNVGEVELYGFGYLVADFEYRVEGG